MNTTRRNFFQYTFGLIGASQFLKGNVLQNDKFNSLSELEKCKINPIYFIEKYVITTDINIGVTTRKLYQWQKDVIQEYYNGKNILGVLPRQSGKNFIETGIILHKLLFEDNVKIGYIYNKNSIMIHQIKYSFENLPYLFRLSAIMTWNANGKIELENGNWIKMENYNSNFDSFRGLGLTHLIQNESAFSGSTVDLGLFPNCKVMMLSTPNGKLNFYNSYLIYKNNPKWFVFKKAWYDIPEKDWDIQNKKQLLGRSLFSQKYQAKFV